MNNRQRYILNVNPYDLLINIQKELSRPDVYCVLDLITEKYHKCKSDSCEECIQQWLNAEGDE